MVIEHVCLLSYWYLRVRLVLGGVDHKYGSGCDYAGNAMCDLIMSKEGRPDPWMRDQGVCSV